MFETDPGPLAEEMKDAPMMAGSLSSVGCFGLSPNLPLLPRWLVSSPQFNFSPMFHLNVRYACLQPNLKVVLPKCTHSMLIEMSTDFCVRVLAPNGMCTGSL